MMPIVIKRADGGISILYPIDMKASSVQAEIEKWKGSVLDSEAYVSHREMPVEAIPADRTFRGAWCDVTPDAVIDIDMPRARDIHLGKLRTERNGKLKALDGPLLVALEKADTVEFHRISDEKQALRDVPERARPLLEAAMTAADLKTITLDDALAVPDKAGAAAIAEAKS